MTPALFFLVLSLLPIATASEIEFQVVRKDCEQYEKTVVVMGLDHSSPATVFSNLINSVSRLALPPSSRHIVCYHAWAGRCLRICNIPSFYNTRYDQHLEHYSFQGKVIDKLKERIGRIHLIIYAHAARRENQYAFLRFWSKTLPEKTPSVVAMTGSFAESDVHGVRGIFKTSNVIYSNALMEQNYDRREMFADLNTRVLGVLKRNELNEPMMSDDFEKMDKWYRTYESRYERESQRFEKMRSDIVQLQEKVLSDPVERKQLERTGLLAYLLEHFNDGSSVMSTVIAAYNRNPETKKSEEAAELLDMIEDACEASGSKVLEYQANLSQASRAVLVDSEITQWWTKQRVDEFCNTAPRRS